MPWGSILKWRRGIALMRLEQYANQQAREGHWTDVIETIEAQIKEDWPSAGVRELEQLLQRAYRERFHHRLDQARTFLGRYFDEGFDRCLSEAEEALEGAQADVQKVSDQDRGEWAHVRIEVEKARESAQHVQAFEAALSEGRLKEAQAALHRLVGTFPDQRLERLRGRFEGQRREGVQAYGSAEEGLRSGELDRCRAALARARKAWVDGPDGDRLSRLLDAAEGLREAYVEAARIGERDLSGAYRIWQRARGYADALPLEVRRVYERGESVEVRLGKAKEAWLADLCGQAEAAQDIQDRLALLDQVVDVDERHDARSERDALRDALKALQGAVKTFDGIAERDMRSAARSLEGVRDRATLEYPPLQERVAELRTRVEKAARRGEELEKRGDLRGVIEALEGVPEGWGVEVGVRLECLRERVQEAQEWMDEVRVELGREQADLDGVDEGMKRVRDVYARHPDLSVLEERLSARLHARDKVEGARKQMGPGRYAQAVALLREAQGLFDGTELRRLLEEAQRGAETDLRKAQAAELLTQARHLRGERALGRALEAYEGVLALDSAHEDALGERAEVVGRMEQVQGLVQQAAQAERASEAVDLLQAAQEVWPKEPVAGRLGELEALLRASDLLRRAREEEHLYHARALCGQARKALPGSLSGRVPPDVAEVSGEIEALDADLEARIREMGIRGPVELRVLGAPRTLVLPIQAYASGIMVGHVRRGMDVQGHNDLSFRFQDVSRTHMKLIWRPKAEYYGLDISRRGTFINGERQKIHRSFRLGEGQELRLGRALRFEVSFSDDSCVLTAMEVGDDPDGEHLPEPGLRVVLLGTRFEVAPGVYVQYQRDWPTLCLERAGSVAPFSEGEVARGVEAVALPEEVVV